MTRVAVGVGQSLVTHSWLDVVRHASESLKPGWASKVPFARATLIGVGATM